MKPPCLPGAEKFRFCDRKFDQIPRKIFSPIVNNINDCCFEEQSLFEIENNRHSPSKNSSSSNEKDPDYLLELSHHSSSSDSLSCHSCIDGRANHLLQSTKTIKCDQKSLDSVSTVSSNLDELIHQMNSYSFDSHRRHGRHPKRKPILPISTRLTSRVLNLTSYHIDTNTNNDNDDDVDDGHHSINNDDEVDADVEDEFEETQSKRNLFPNEIEKKSFTNCMMKTRNSCCSDSLDSQPNRLSKKANEQQQQQQQQQQHQLPLLDYSELSRSSTPNSSFLCKHNDVDDDDDGVHFDVENQNCKESRRRPSPENLKLNHNNIDDVHHHHHRHHRHLYGHQLHLLDLDPDPLQHHLPPHHHHHHSDRIIIPVPSHSSLMSSDASSSSMSLSMNREEYESDSFLRSSSCSPLDEESVDGEPQLQQQRKIHQQRQRLLHPQLLWSTSILKNLNKNKNNNNHNQIYPSKLISKSNSNDHRGLAKRLSTLSAASWDCGSEDRGCGTIESYLIVDR